MLGRMSENTKPRRTLLNEVSGLLNLSSCSEHFRMLSSLLDPNYFAQVKQADQ